jgi:short-subunit dehydrogenase
MALCIIVGFGTGVGAGIAKAFGKAGFSLGLIARSPEKYTDAVQALKAQGLSCEIVQGDAANTASLEDAIATLIQDQGAPAVLVYNVVSGHFGKPSTLSSAQLIHDFHANVVGALIATQAVLPAMQNQAQGCILFTGGGWAHYPWDGAASMSIGKAGIRSLALTLGQELKDTPVQVGLLSIMGQVAVGTDFDPDKIGEAFVSLYQKLPEGHETELMFKG